jgi:glucose 1-dehydrogenase
MKEVFKLSLIGKVALVTGAGTGIGKGIAIELAKKGVKVAVHYNSSDSGAKDTQKRIQELGGEAILIQANVAHKQEIEAMADAVANHYGGIDILVNNAAMQLNLGLFQHTEQTYDQLMHVNLKGYWQCMQAVIPYMKIKNSGRIIFISSVHGKRPTDFDTVYAMTKGGIKMLCREAAIELAKYGITVNSIEPGAVDVGKFSSTRPQEKTGEGEVPAANPNYFMKKYPLGRIGKPADVGHLVCYIASEDSEYMTGASIRLDGGSMLL